MEETLCQELLGKTRTNSTLPHATVWGAEILVPPIQKD